jgi:hypothetical protein
MIADAAMDRSGSLGDTLSLDDYEVCFAFDDGSTRPRMTLDALAE